MSDFDVTGLKDAWIRTVGVRNPDDEGEEYRFGFELGIEATTERALTGGPTIKVGSSIPYDPALPWSEIEKGIAQRAVEVLRAVRELTPEQLFGLLAKGRVPTFAAIQSAVDRHGQ